MQVRARSNALPYAGPSWLVAPAFARAVRPLAASARPKRFVAGAARCAEPAAAGEERLAFGDHSFFVSALKPRSGTAQFALAKVTARSKRFVAVPSRQGPRTKFRAFVGFAGSGFGSLGGRATHRRSRAGAVPQIALPNLSIEATANGVQRSGAFAHAVPPLAAPHLKR